MELSSTVHLFNASGLYFKLCERHLEQKLSRIKALMLLLRGSTQMEGLKEYPGGLPSSSRSHCAAVRHIFSRGQY